MKSIFIYVLLIALLLTLPSLPAQNLALTGYYENQLFPQKIEDDLLLQDYNKLRLDLAADIGEKMAFNADYIYRTYHGATTFNLLDFVPDRLVQNYAAAVGKPLEDLQQLFDLRSRDENFLDNAFVTLYARHFSLRIGKQQLPWGSGYAWNPTDIFNEKNLLDPTYEKVGVNALKVEVPWAGMGQLTGILSPEKNWDASTKALKIKQHAAGFDLSASFVEKRQTGFDYFTFASTGERRRLFGGDFSGALLGLGVWGEGAWNAMEKQPDYSQWLLGADYTLRSGLYLMAEFYHNGLGRRSRDAYTFGDWMRLLSAQGENLGRSYLYAGQLYPLSELLNWSNYLIFNFDDRSGIFLPWFDYNLGDNTEVLLVGYIPFGPAESEFVEFGPGGIARIRVYF